MEMTARQRRGAQFGVLLLLVTFAWIVIRVVFSPPSDVENLEGNKRYAFDVAEGFRLRNPKLPVDSIAFRACRVEKMRRGALTFGGFNVLIVDGLVLNLPFDRSDSDESPGTNEVRRLSSQVGLTDAVRKSVGLGGRKFSGIRIKGLTVNRMAENGVQPVFTASSAENRGKSLVLRGCIVFDGEISNNVGNATLHFQPAKIDWAGGSVDLGDLFSFAPLTESGKSHKISALCSEN